MIFLKGYKSLLMALILVTLVGFMAPKAYSGFVPDPQGGGALPAPHWECISYVYDLEFAHYNQFSPPQRKLMASNNAIKACSTGEDKECIEHLYLRYQDIFPGTETYILLHRAIKACQGPLLGDCVKTAEKMLTPFRNPLKALEEGLNICRFDVRSTCLMYAYENELEHRVSESRKEAQWKAVNQAGQICKSGVSKNCLALLHEEILVPLHPDAKKRWGNAVNGCRKRP